MIWIDFVIVSLAVVSVLLGLWQGLIQQAYSLFCWLLAILVGLGFSREFTMFLSTSISDVSARLAAAFVILCFLTVFIGGLIRLILGELLKTSGLTVGERFGGMLCGFAHSLLFVLILVMLAGLSVLPQSPWWKKSKLIPPFQTTVLWLHDQVSFDITKNVHYR